MPESSEAVGGTMTRACGWPLADEYTLTVVRSEGDPTPLSRTYSLKMNSHVNAGQQSNIVFKRSY